MPYATVAIIATLTMMAAPRDVSAHLGGEVVRPVFLSPSPTMLTVSEPLTVAWNDPDADPTGVFHFFVVAGRNVPPTAEPVEELLGGTEVASVAVSDTTDALTIDLSSLPAGAYTLYALTRDPPLCEQVTPLHAMLRVGDEDPSAATPMMALWRKPSDPLTTISGVYPLRLAVSSETQPSFTLEVGRMVNDVGGDPADPCSGRQRFEPAATLVSDELATPDNEGGANLWIARYVWTEPTNLEAGTYIVKATLTNLAEDTLTLFSPGEIQILTPEGPDEGPEPSEEVSGAAESDLAEELPDPGGCRATASSPRGWGWCWMLVLLCAAATHRRRERTTSC